MNSEEYVKIPPLSISKGAAKIIPFQMIMKIKIEK
jgi:hypothetical protein